MSFHLLCIHLVDISRESREIPFTTPRFNFHIRLLLRSLPPFSFKLSWSRWCPANQLIGWWKKEGRGFGFPHLSLLRQSTKSNLLPPAMDKVKKNKGESFLLIAFGTYGKGPSPTGAACFRHFQGLAAFFEKWVFFLGRVAVLLERNPFHLNSSKPLLFYNMCRFPGPIRTFFPALKLLQLLQSLRSWGERYCSERLHQSILSIRVLFCSFPSQCLQRNFGEECED